MSDTNSKMKSLYDMLSKLKVDATPQNVELLYSMFYTIKSVIEELDSQEVGD